MKAIENYLLKVLSNNDVTFFIPPYQRNYEWDEDQCDVFFNDVLKVTKSNLIEQTAEHFFGTIVYVQDDAIFGQPAKLILTDGQQRITTTMLFLVAIRDSLNEQSHKDFIDSKYLKNNNNQAEDEYKIKLKQVETDWEAYKNIILNLELTDEHKKSAVYKNYQYFKKRLSNLKSQDQIDNLTTLISLGLDKFSIVTIQLEPEKNKWENPQEIFESMNSLGKPLSLADLVRNYLLLGQSASNQDHLYKNYWLPIEHKIPEKISDFLRDFMQLKAKRDFKKATSTNFKELYMQFKELFKETDAFDLLTELNKYSTYYAYIVLGTTTQDKLIDTKLADLRSINVTIAYSFLLDIIAAWANDELSNTDVIGILDALIIFFLRRRILKLTQAENKVFPTFVREHENIVSSFNKQEKIFEILGNQEYALRLPNDSEIINELETMNFYNFSQAKFILSLIEENITKSRPDRSDKLLQIEHIMPQTLTAEWQNELGDDYENTHQNLINTIGNLTLIRHNQELGNKPFSEKKEIYQNNAGLQIAKNEIINRSKWNKISINNRKKWISNLIVNNLLPIPHPMKAKNNYSDKRYSRRFSFSNIGLIGKQINFIADKSIIVEVVNDAEVKFEGKNWRLSPLTRELETRRGTVTASGAYQGSQYWEFEGIKLAELM